ncbi:EscU/YscU/HrcU family type III secretion system export apparatus switch protein [Clostridiaceae bacterium 35-E11]
MKEKKKIAAALQYDQRKDAAPVVIAKGEGIIAQKIEEIGKELDIPTYKDEQLVKQLNNLGIGEEIPSALYQVVAEILAFVIQIDTRKGIPDE